MSAVSRVLADTYTLYLKTHNFQWNVTGPHFTTLHTLFEEHYTEMWQAVDEIAERIRGLGAFAPGTARELSQLSSGTLTLASNADDESTVDLLTQRLQIHEKTASGP